MTPENQPNKDLEALKPLFAEKVSMLDSPENVDYEGYKLIAEGSAKAIDALEAKADGGDIDARIKLQEIKMFRDRLVKIGKRMAENGKLTDDEKQEFSKITYQLRTSLLSVETSDQPYFSFGYYKIESNPEDLKGNKEVTTILGNAKKQQAALEKTYNGCVSGISKNNIFLYNKLLKSHSDEFLKLVRSGKDKDAIANMKAQIEFTIGQAKDFVKVSASIEKIYKNKNVAEGLLNQAMGNRDIESVKAQASSLLSEFSADKLSRDALFANESFLEESDRNTVVDDLDEIVLPLKMLSGVESKELTTFFEVLGEFDAEDEKTEGKFSKKFLTDALNKLLKAYPDLSKLGNVIGGAVGEFIGGLKEELVRDSIAKVDTRDVKSLAKNKEYSKYLRFIDNDELKGPFVTNEYLALKAKTKFTLQERAILTTIDLILADYSVDVTIAEMDALLLTEKDPSLIKYYKATKYLANGDMFAAQNVFVQFMRETKDKTIYEEARIKTHEYLIQIANYLAGELKSRLGDIDASLETDARVGRWTDSTQPLKREYMPMHNYIKAQERAVGLALEIMERNADILTLKDALDKVEGLASLPMKGSPETGSTEEALQKLGFSSDDMRDFGRKYTDHKESSFDKWVTSKYSSTEYVGTFGDTPINLNVLGKTNFNAGSFDSRDLHAQAVMLTDAGLYTAAEKFYEKYFEKLLSDTAKDDLDRNTFIDELLNGSARPSQVFSEEALRSGSYHDIHEKPQGKTDFERELQENREKVISDFKDTVSDFEQKDVPKFLKYFKKEHGRDANINEINTYKINVKRSIAEGFWKKAVHERIVYQIGKGWIPEPTASQFQKYNNDYLSIGDKWWEFWKMDVRTRNSLGLDMTCSAIEIMVSGGFAAGAREATLGGFTKRYLTKAIGKEIAEREIDAVMKLTIRQLIAGETGNITDAAVKAFIKRSGKNFAYNMLAAKFRALSAEALVFSELQNLAGIKNPGGVEALLDPVEHLKRFGHSVLVLGVLKGTSGLLRTGNKLKDTVLSYTAAPVVDTAVLTGLDYALAGFDSTGLNASIRNNFLLSFGLRSVHGLRDVAKNRDISKFRDNIKKRNDKEFERRHKGVLPKEVYEGFKAMSDKVDPLNWSDPVPEGLTPDEASRLYHTLSDNGLSPEIVRGLNRDQVMKVVENLKDYNPQKGGDILLPPDFEALLKTPEGRVTLKVYLSNLKEIPMTADDVIKVLDVDAELGNDIINRMAELGRNDVLIDLAKKGFMDPLSSVIAPEEFAQLTKDLASDDEAVVKAAEKKWGEIAQKLAETVKPWVVNKLTAFTFTLLFSRTLYANFIDQAVQTGEILGIAFNNFLLLPLGYFLYKVLRNAFELHGEMTSETPPFENKSGELVELLSRLKRETARTNRDIGNLGVEDTLRARKTDVAKRLLSLQGVKSISDVTDKTLYSPEAVEAKKEIDRIFLKFIRPGIPLDSSGLPDIKFDDANRADLIKQLKALGVPNPDTAMFPTGNENIRDVYEKYLDYYNTKVSKDVAVVESKLKNLPLNIIKETLKTIDPGDPIKIIDGHLKKIGYYSDMDPDRIPVFQDRSGNPVTDIDTIIFNFESYLNSRPNLGSYDGQINLLKRIAAKVNILEDGFGTPITDINVVINNFEAYLRSRPDLGLSFDGPIASLRDLATKVSSDEVDKLLYDALAGAKVPKTTKPTTNGLTGINNAVGDAKKDFKEYSGLENEAELKLLLNQLSSEFGALDSIVNINNESSVLTVLDNLLENLRQIDEMISGNPPPAPAPDTNPPKPRFRDKFKRKPKPKPVLRTNVGMNGVLDKISGDLDKMVPKNEAARTGLESSLTALQSSIRELRTAIGEFRIALTEILSGNELATIVRDLAQSKSKLKEPIDRQVTPEEIQKKIAEKMKSPVAKLTNALSKVDEDFDLLIQKAKTTNIKHLPDYKNFRPTLAWSIILILSSITYITTIPDKNDTSAITAPVISPQEQENLDFLRTLTSPELRVQAVFTRDGVFGLSKQDPRYLADNKIFRQWFKDNRDTIGTRKHPPTPTDPTDRDRNDTEIDVIYKKSCELMGLPPTMNH